MKGVLKMNALREIRIKNQLTQQELANQLGVTQRYVAFVEKGERTPSLDIAFKMAAILRSSVEDIFLSKMCTKSTHDTKATA
jgi:putative transcriptional regulator